MGSLYRPKVVVKIKVKRLEFFIVGKIMKLKLTLLKLQLSLGSIIFELEHNSPVHHKPESKV
jgi:hypothetical protein